MLTKEILLKELMCLVCLAFCMVEENFVPVLYQYLVCRHVFMGEQHFCQTNFRLRQHEALKRLQFIGNFHLSFFLFWLVTKVFLSTIFTWLHDIESITNWMFDSERFCYTTSSKGYKNHSEDENKYQDDSKI